MTRSTCKPTPTDPPPPAKHKARRSSFAAALADAEKRLAQADRQRSAAQATLTHLAVEIPRLHGIILALGGTPPVVNLNWHGQDPHQVLFEIGPPYPWEKPLAEIPDGAGSIPVNADGAAQPAGAPDLDSLPGMAEGDWK